MSRKRKRTIGKEGVPLRHCMIDYIGYGGKMYEQLYDDTPMPKLEKIRCNFIDPKTGKRCITMLNQNSLKRGLGLCELHRNCHLWRDNEPRL